MWCAALVLLLWKLGRAAGIRSTILRIGDSCHVRRGTTSIDPTSHDEPTLPRSGRRPEALRLHGARVTPRRSRRGEHEVTAVPDRFRSRTISTLLAAIFIAGCTVKVDEDSRDRQDEGIGGAANRDGDDGTGGANAGNDGDDETVAVANASATALVTGRVDASVSGDIRIFVNDAPRFVVLAPDRSFVIRDVPSGDVTLTCEVGGVRGSIPISGVKPGELIEIAVRVDVSVVITVSGRSPSTEPPRTPTEPSGTVLEIRKNNVRYVLNAGTYTREIVILGNNVVLLGSAGCSNRTILTGSLTVRGNNALVQDVELRGSAIVSGNNARFQDSCSGCFADACYPGPGGGAGKGRSRGSSPGTR
jgi:hypothetical protein